MTHTLVEYGTKRELRQRCPEFEALSFEESPARWRGSIASGSASHHLRRAPAARAGSALALWPIGLPRSRILARSRCFGSRLRAGRSTTYPSNATAIDSKSPRPISRRGPKVLDAEYMQVICPTCQLRKTDRQCRSDEPTRVPQPVRFLQVRLRSPAQASRSHG